MPNFKEQSFNFGEQMLLVSSKVQNWSTTFSRVFTIQFDALQFREFSYQVLIGAFQKTSQIGEFLFESYSFMVIEQINLKIS